MNDLAVLKVEVTQPGVQFARTSATVLDPKLTIEEVGALIDQAAGLNDTTKWWIGDLLLFAEANFHEQYAQLLDETKLTEHQVEEYSYVARKVAPSVRTGNLSFSHHRLVAALEPPDQARLLTLAEAGEMSVASLREAVRDHKAFEAPPSPPRRQTVLPTPSEVDAARGLRTIRETLTKVGDGISPEGREATGVNQAMRAVQDVGKTVKRATSLESLALAVAAVIAAGVRQSGLPDPAVIVPAEPWDTLVAAYATATEGGST